METNNCYSSTVLNLQTMNKLAGVRELFLNYYRGICTFDNIESRVVNQL